MCAKAEFLRGQDDQFSYPIIVHILLDSLSDMCHNNDSSRDESGSDEKTEIFAMRKNGTKSSLYRKLTSFIR